MVWCSDLDEKQALIESEPDKFCTVAHYDSLPMVLVRLGAVELDELEEVLTESWRIRAPAKVAGRFPADGGSR